MNIVKERRLISTLAVIICLLLIFVLSPLMFGLDNGDEDEYNKVMQQLSELEDLAESYVKKNNVKNMSAQEITCIYIRCERYNSRT